MFRSIVLMAFSPLHLEHGGVATEKERTLVHLQRDSSIYAVSLVALSESVIFCRCFASLD